MLLELEPVPVKYFVQELGCSLELQAAPIKVVDATDSCGQCQLLAEWLPHRGGSGPPIIPQPRVGSCSNRWRVMSKQVHSTSEVCAYVPTTYSSNQWLPSGHPPLPLPLPPPALIPGSFKTCGAIHSPESLKSHMEREGITKYQDVSPG